jgi:hypothetical protein
MKINQYQKERIINLVNHDKNIKEIHQFTESVFLVIFDNGGIIPLSISKLGKMEAHEYFTRFSKSFFDDPTTIKIDK